MYSGKQACCAAKGFSIFTYEASNTAVVILELIMTSQKKEVYLLLYEEGLKQVVGIFARPLIRVLGPTRASCINSRPETAFAAPCIFRNQH